MAICYYPEISCLSTDTKPTVADGFSLVETDTGNWFVRSGAAWVAATNPDFATAIKEGAPGADAPGNIDGGASDTNYGGSLVIDGGGA